MASTEAQKRASAKYNRANVTTRTVSFGVNDRDILAWLDAQPSKAGYIKRLIREDMEAHTDPPHECPTLRLK